MHWCVAWSNIWRMAGSLEKIDRSQSCNTSCNSILSSYNVQTTRLGFKKAEKNCIFVQFLKEGEDDPEIRVSPTIPACNLGLNGRLNDADQWQKPAENCISQMSYVWFQRFWSNEKIYSAQHVSSNTEASCLQMSGGTFDKIRQGSWYPRFVCNPLLCEFHVLRKRSWKLGLGYKSASASLSSMHAPGRAQSASVTSGSDLEQLLRPV